MDSEVSEWDLMEMLRDKNAIPRDLPLSLLKRITNGFSEQIGSGGFAIVYKGELQNGLGSVAVKKLQTIDLDETKFLQEVSSLMQVKHENIVRFLGYCSDTQGKVLKVQGKNVMAEERQRFLCFEFLPEGSLDKHISSAREGLDWKTRYQIIRGTCEGLHYLHLLNIVHLDLKPANILLDHGMVPKIADFGLARCFDENQTRATTSNVFGSLGYMAPESFRRVITRKADIYSLGIIIMEILTGERGFLELQDVLEIWSNRLMSLGARQLMGPIRVCAELSKECTEYDPTKRPDTGTILKKLDEMESTYGITVKGKRLLLNKISTSISKLVDRVQPMLVCRAPSPLQQIMKTSEPKGLGDTSTKMLDVHPLELTLPWEPHKSIECPLTLANRTENYVGVWITPVWERTSWDICIELPGANKRSLYLYRRMDPCSTLAVAVTLEKRPNPPPREAGEFEVLMIVMNSKDNIRHLESSFGSRLMYNDVLKRVEELGGEVHHAMLKAVICDQASFHDVACHTFIPATPIYEGYTDMHPTEPWILRCDLQHISLFNYETQETVMVSVDNQQVLTGRQDHPCSLYRGKPFDARDFLCSVKFIAREGWIVIGNCTGWVHIYAYNTKNVVKNFQAYSDVPVQMLAVHQTSSMLLTSSYDSWIKLWDWGQDWQCIGKFDNENWPSYIMWNLLDADSFVSICKSGMKIWRIHSSKPIEIQDQVKTCCFDPNCHRIFMVNSPRGKRYGAIHIRDVHTEESQKLLMDETIEVACHPVFPILVTTNGSKTVNLWDARNYRLLKIVRLKNMPVRGMMVFPGNGGSVRSMAITSTMTLVTRFMVPCTEGIEIIEISLFPTLLKTDY